MADDLSIFGGLPGDADDERIRKARRKLRLRNAFEPEGPLPPRPSASAVGGKGVTPGPPPAVPANTVAPAITGTVAVGSMLSCSTGTWTNSPTSYLYSWISGSTQVSTAATYVPQAGDVGNNIFCRVQARNAAGFGTPASSNTVGPVTAASPSSTWSAADASVTGMTLTNSNMTAKGITTGGAAPPTIRGTVSKTAGKLYIEFLCVATNTSDYVYFGLGSSGIHVNVNLGAVGNISSAGVTWSITDVTFGFTANYTTTATPAVNDVWGMAVDFGAGSMWLAQNNVWLNSSNPATATAPIVSFVPATVGALFPGMSLFVSETWTLQPTAASQTYAPPSGFTAWDSGGGTVSPTLPVNTVAPVASGSLTVGSTLSCTTGTWTGTPTPTYAYQWQRGGVNISGATSSTYLTVMADRGTSVTCVVTATNTVGNASATSNALAIQGAPVNSVAPVASGTLTIGSTLSVTNGTWTNSPTGYTYQWLRGGTAISGATSATYLTVTADGGTNVSCAVTATNAAGSTSVTSNALAIAAGGSSSTWSTTDATAGHVTLSNANMTAVVTSSTPSTGVTVRGTSSHSSGKWYCEILMPNGTATANQAWGYASSGANAGNMLGLSNYGVGITLAATAFASTGFTNNYASMNFSLHANDVLGLAIDFGAGAIWISYNGVWQGDAFGSATPSTPNPATGLYPIVSFVPATVGALFPAIGLGDLGIHFTLLATAASQSYAPPSGFSAWG